MKLRAYINPTDASGQATIQPPSTGYYCNVRMIAAIDGDTEEGFVYFGKRMAAGQSVDVASGAAEMVLLPDLKKQGMYMDLLEGALFDVDQAAAVKFYTKFSKRKIFIDEFEVVNITWRTEDTASLNLWIEADFIPEPGSKVQFGKTWVSETDPDTKNFGDGFKIPETMMIENVELIMVGQATTTDKAGTLIVKAFDSPQPEFAPVLNALELGDLLSQTPHNTESIESGHNVLTEQAVFFDIDQPSAWGYKDSDPGGRIIEAGTVIGWDYFPVITGDPSTFTVIIKINGILGRKLGSKGKMYTFMQGLNVLDFNDWDG